MTNISLGILDTNVLNKNRELFRVSPMPPAAGGGDGDGRDGMHSLPLAMVHRMIQVGGATYMVHCDTFHIYCTAAPSYAMAESYGRSVGVVTLPLLQTYDLSYNSPTFLISPYYPFLSN